MISKRDVTCGDCKRELKDLPCLTTGIKEIDDLDMICGSCLKEQQGEESYNYWKGIIFNEDKQNQ